MRAVHPCVIVYDFFIVAQIKTPWPGLAGRKLLIHTTDVIPVGVVILLPAKETCQQNNMSADYPKKSSTHTWLTNALAFPDSQKVGDFTYCLYLQMFFGRV